MVASFRQGGRIFFFFPISLSTEYVFICKQPLRHAGANRTSYLGATLEDTEWSKISTRFSSQTAAKGKQHQEDSKNFSNWGTWLAASRHRVLASRCLQAIPTRRCPKKQGKIGKGEERRKKSNRKIGGIPSPPFALLFLRLRAPNAVNLEVLSREPDPLLGAEAEEASLLVGGRREEEPERGTRPERC